MEVIFLEVALKGLQEDMEDALDKLDGTELHRSKVRLVKVNLMFLLLLFFTCGSICASL